MVRIYWFLFIVIPALLISASSDQDRLLLKPSQQTLSLEQVLARTKEAAGGSRWDDIRTVRISWEAEEGGLNGKVEEFDDLVGARYRDASDFVVRSSAYGFNGKIAWSQDSSGRSQIEEGNDSREGTVNEAFRRSLAYWYPERWRGHIEYGGPKQEGGLLFQVLRITPDGGRPFELWFDGSTYLLSRLVEKTSVGVLNAFFTDYRVINNLQIPFTVRVQPGSGGENIYRVKKIEFNQSLADSRFDIPPPPPPDFVIARKATAASLPLELINNHVYVSAKLNGQGPFKFLVDTGWGTSSITPEVDAINDDFTTGDTERWIDSSDFSRCHTLIISTHPALLGCGANGLVIQRRLLQGFFENCKLIV